MDSIIGKSVNYPYGNLRGKVIDEWKLEKGMILVKIDCGDSSYAILNKDVVFINE